ncbi:MAG TPA: Holliday junction resolvase RuvX [Acidimicrobiales bacterium]|jgi:putative Holliday junction resolvase|nr:Holliday junction resolvase RuvX [Acidimicrobiales bacterium]
MRALGLDLGSKRIGVAVSDDQGRVATPIETINRSRGDREVDHRAMVRLVDDWAAGVVVVGLPLSLDGTEGPAARAVRDEVAELRDVLAVPVELVDERFTTVTADRHLREQGVRGKSRTAVIDRAAAAVLLQSWLDRQRPGSTDA